MFKRCINCKYSDVYYDDKHKLSGIYCKKLLNEIPLKRYSKMKQCLYHIAKEDV